MENRTWHHVDKSAWGPGPWQDEPDKEQWSDEATGFACLVLRSEIGSLCGYVGVPEGHPWHGVSCWDLNGLDLRRELTFSGECDEAGPECKTICHVAPGEPELWWLGFHCAYASDLSPTLFVLPAGVEIPGSSFLRESQTYRPVSYVKALCAALALEAKNAVPAV